MIWNPFLLFPTAYTTVSHAFLGVSGCKPRNGAMRRHSIFDVFAREDGGASPPRLSLSRTRDV